MTPERWSRIERICQAALDRRANERTAYVAEACSGDDELRHEVETLLAEECRVAGFMSRPAVAVSGEPVGDAASLVGRAAGAYLITEWLGAGGMGEVYRAHDAELRRDVAIKILSREFAGNRERLERFRREARILASLNHPNIGAIYGLEHLDGVPAIVLELVEGPTLAERLARGPLPIDEAVSIAVQIIEALDAAHGRGIVHRDLKPSNIKLTAGGGVKVLDFGLAKELGDPAPDLPAGMPRAAGDSVSAPGAIVGTAAYMSPEQASGQALDVRSDIFSFGVVLYEMVTARPEPADSSTSLVDRIRSGTLPSPRRINPGVPPRFEAIILRAIEKERGARYQSAAEVRAAFKNLTLDDAAPVSARRRRVAAAAAPVAVVAAAIAIGALAWTRSSPSSPSAPIDYAQVTDFADSATSPALSPDGRMVSFIRGRSTFQGPGQIYVKALPDGEPQQLTDDRLSKMSPIFSPDGGRIAYTAVSGRFEWDTWIVSLRDRRPQKWLANASGLSWRSERHILFSEITSGLHMSLVGSDEARSAVQPIYAPSHEAGMVHRSALSPDARWILVVEMENPVWQQCRVIPADGSGAGWRIGRPGQCTYAAWSPDGRWMYFSSNAGGTFHIWRQRFPDGPSEQLTAGPTEEEGLALAPDGASLLTSIGSRQSSMWIRDAGGEREISGEGYAFVPTLPNGSSQPFSADGGRVFYLIRRGASRSPAPEDRSGSLWMTDLSTGRSQPLFPEHRIVGYDLARDNRRIAFAALDERGTPHVWVGSIEGQSTPRQMSRLPADNPRFAGNELLCIGNDGAARFIYRIRDGGELEKLVDRSVLFLMSASRDGAWLIGRVATDDGRAAQATLAFPMAGGAPVTVCDLCEADWTPDGASLVLRLTGDQQQQRTVLIADTDQVLRRLPPKGIQSEADLSRLAVQRKIDGFVYPAGGDAQLIAFSRVTIHRNIYRVPIAR
jgi:serine/threonine protein kinase